MNSRTLAKKLQARLLVLPQYCKRPGIRVLANTQVLPRRLTGRVIVQTKKGTVLAAGIEKQQLTVGRFDLGVPQPRCYRQLVSLAIPEDATRVIVARSVSEGPELPIDTPLAYTLDPNGEVLHFECGRLHWHHICCTPGAGVLPGRLDRWLINALRITGLDLAERRTYRKEAEQLRDWISGPEIELPD